ncbi:MAG: hypothetical protein ACXVHJ_05275 [Solirubrobacteraceae bacterium]
MTKIGAATQILHGIGAPVNQHTVGAMLGWFNAEGGNWGNSAAHNPLNTTQGAPGARSINGVGVKAYGNWGQGIAATVQTLKNGHYGQIIQAFHNSDPQGVAQAIASSPWGTNGQLVHQTIGQAVGQRYSLPSAAGIGQRMAAPQQPGSPGLSAVTQQEPATTSTDWGTALADALLNSSSGVDTSGKVTVKNPLGAAINAVNSGQYTTTTPGYTKTLSPAVAATAAAARAGARGSLRGGTFNAGLGKGDINPLGAGWALGRTDQGVDANAAPGTPIHAMNDSRVVDVQHNWYAGQPLVLMQITSGPNKGKYWYVAEQISQNAHVGQFFPRGSVVATYAPSGTGIEIGWGHPGGGDTLAQAQGNTGGPGHSNAPAGADFRKNVLRA